MKEYGGYIEFERYDWNMMHNNAIALNCGRNALSYLCEAKKIKKLYLPYFLCSSVFNLCRKISVECDFYRIGYGFEPIFGQKLDKNEWLYIVNYYGQLDNATIQLWKQRYDRIIVDNAQSYFQMPVEGVDTIYTCRKYFGVSDGAFLYTDAKLQRDILQDESYDRMHFLMGRYERSASEFYNEYVENNSLFASEPIKKMSRLTNDLLHGINYEHVARIREDNFNYLNAELGNINQLKLKSIYGAFMYPLLIQNGAVMRKILQNEKIYIPTLWPNVLKECTPNSLEYHFAANILPIPVDQRYGIRDMKYLVKAINCALSKIT